MDTDSFILSTKATNLLKDFEYLKKEFDITELDNSHQLYDAITKKGICKEKIETSPIIAIDNFVALRSKSYLFSYNVKTKRNTTYTNPHGVIKFTI